MREQSDNFTDANAARVLEPRYLVELSFSAPATPPAQNLLTRSEEFDNAAWSQINAPVITANQTPIAPDGTTTADQIEDNSGSNYEYIYQDSATFDVTRSYTASIYVAKDSTGRATRFPMLRIAFFGAVSELNSIYFDTETGEFELDETVSGTVSGGVEDATPEYWRVYVTAYSDNQSNSTMRISLYPAAGASATWVESAGATGSVVIWGAQLAGTDVLTDYNKTEAAADTSETGLKRCNMFTRSEDFTSPDWTKTSLATATADQAEAPDGTTTADELDDSSAGAAGYLLQQYTVKDITAAHTLMLFVKKDTTGRASRFPAFLLLYQGSTTESNELKLDTATGEFDASSASDNVTFSVIDFSPDYWRVAITATSNDGSNTLLSFRIYPARGASATWVNGSSATGSIFAWGAQVAEADRVLPYYPTVDHINIKPDGRDLVRYYVSSHSGTLAPDGQGGNVYHDMIKGISGQSQQIKPDTARHTIGSITISFSDIDGRLTGLISDNLAAGDGLNRKRIRIYKGHESLTDFDDYSRRITYLIEAIDYHDGVYNFRCDDIQRIEKTTLFEPDQAALTRSILADTDEIPITVANASTKFNTVKHDANYSANPSATVGYITLDDEIIAHSGYTDGTFTALAVVERGALNTRPAIHTVNQTQTDQKKRVTEYFYLEGPAVKLIYAMLTGDLYGEGATLPDNWHLNIDTEFVRRSDFTGIGSDLWDLENNAGRLARFVGLEPTEGKAFIERELLVWLNCFMPVYSDGALGLKRLKGVTPDSGHDVYLDEEEIVSYGPLRHDMKSLINNMSIKWNWVQRLEAFTKTTFLFDTDSIAKHSKSKLKEFEFLGVFNGVHSDSDIFNYFSAIRDRYANPPELLQLEVMPEWDRLEVGDTARVVCSQIRDYAKPDTLDRVFEIQQVKTDWVTGKVWLNLFGGIERSTELTLSSSNVMADAYYTTGGTNLTSVLTISGNAITANGTINGGADNTAAIFYYDGDLTLNSGITLTINRNVLLRIKGTFTINGTINLEGNSADIGEVGVTWSGYAAKLELIGGSYIEAIKGRDSTLSAGAYPELPVFNILNPDGLQLDGIPPDLAGRKGATGTAARSVGVGSAAGGAGGAGGGGLVVVSRGGAIGASGSIDTSGSAGSVGSSVFLSLVEVHAQTGAGGFPGGVLWLIDGNYSFPAFDSSNFTATRGASTPPGGVNIYATSQGQRVENDAANEVYGQQITDNANYFEAVTRIQYIPPAENGFKWLPEDQRRATAPFRDLLPLMINNLENIPTPNRGLYNVALWKDGVFVVAGLVVSGDTEIDTSPDGRKWTARSNPGTNADDDARGGAVSDNYFVLALGGGIGSGNGAVLYSTDGITWSRVQPTNHTYFNGVAYGNGVYVLVGNSDGTDASLFTATNPATWTERANPKSFALNAVCYSAELDLWAAAGQPDGTDCYLITASDPTGTWTERSNPGNNFIYGLAAGNGLIVGVGKTGAGAPYIIYSDDGITWTEATGYPVTTDGPLNVRFINGLFIACGDSLGSTSGAVLWISEDGDQWSKVDNLIPGASTLTDIAFDGSRLVLSIGVNESGVMISPRIEAE